MLLLTYLPTYGSLYVFFWDTLCRPLGCVYRTRNGFTSRNRATRSVWRCAKWCAAMTVNIRAVCSTPPAKPPPTPISSSGNQSSKSFHSHHIRSSSRATWVALLVEHFFCTEMQKNKRFPGLSVPAKMAVRSGQVFCVYDVFYYIFSFC